MPAVGETLGATSGEACLIVLAGSNLGAFHKLTDQEVTIGRALDNDLVLTDDGVSHRHARVYLSPEGEYFIEDLGSSNGTFCNGLSVEQQSLTDGDRIVLGSATILKFAIKDNLEVSFHETMFSASVRDWLTQCYNKRYFEEHLALELAWMKRHSSPLSLLMMDLDHFKDVNDTHGHRAGDHVLRELCADLSKIVRQEDLLARFGGEEFVILARGVSREGALTLAERCRQCVQDARFTFSGKTILVTISIGICTVPIGSSFSAKAVIQAADAELYRAKMNGRNQVSIGNITSSVSKQT